MNRRTAILIGITATAVAGVAGGRWLAGRDTRAMRSEKQITRDRDFDWSAFLRDWNERVKLGVAQMLVQHGIGGLPARGIAKHIQSQTQDARVLELLQPIEGSVTSIEGIHELIREGQDRLSELSERVDLRHLVAYEWEVIRNGGLSFGRAEAADIQRLESRLGVSLPPSYKAFLGVSNGWLMWSSRLVPVGDVQRFGEKDPEYVRDWDIAPSEREPTDVEYYKYGAEQLPYNIRTRYLRDCLLISTPVTEVNERLLLNPHVQFDDGEWEAWLMAPWLAGAVRFQSFVELMQVLRRKDKEWWTPTSAR